MSSPRFTPGSNAQASTPSPKVEDSLYKIVTCFLLVARETLRVPGSDRLCVPPSIPDEQSTKRYIQSIGAEPIKFFEDELIPKLTSQVPAILDGLKAFTTADLSPEHQKSFKNMMERADAFHNSIEQRGELIKQRAKKDLKLRLPPSAQHPQQEAVETHAEQDTVDDLLPLFEMASNIVYLLRYIKEPCLPTYNRHRDAPWRISTASSASMSDITIGHPDKKVLGAEVVCTESLRAENRIQRVHQFYVQQHPDSLVDDALYVALSPPLDPAVPLPPMPRRKKAEPPQPDTSSSGSLHPHAIFKLAIQVLHYTSKQESRSAILTDLHRSFEFLRIQVQPHGTRNVYVHNLDFTAEPTQYDSHAQQILAHLIYFVDTFQGLPGPPLLPQDLPLTGSLGGSGRRSHSTPRSTAPTNNSPHSCLTSARRTIMPIFSFGVMQDSIRFHMALLHSTLVIYVSQPWFLRFVPSIALVLHTHSRQGVLLKTPDSLIYVKVYIQDSAFNAELKALKSLRKHRVPPLVGTGKTCGGNHFIVTAALGQTLTQDLNQSEAQLFYDTVLRPIHQDGFHHHDIHPGNIVRDPSQRYHLIDFADSTDQCEGGDDCPDREWLEGEGVRHSSNDVRVNRRPMNER